MPGAQRATWDFRESGLGPSPFIVCIRKPKGKSMAIRWDKFTIKAQEAIQAANDIASEHGNPEMLPLHILSALVSDKEGVVAPVLGKIGLNVDALKQSAEREIAALPKQSGGGV